MSDITGALQPASATALRADAGVIAAFGANPVKIYDIAPDNAVEPYLVLGPAQVSPIQAEGFDLSETDYPVHVWSRTNPPGFAESQAIAAAVRVCMLGVRVSTGGRVYDALPLRTVQLLDPGDNRTVHVIVTTRFTTAPG